jgi:hypothetical protein
LVAKTSSRVILVALAVASFGIAQPALAADSSGQAQASMSSASSAPRGGTWANAELVPETAALAGGDWAGVGGLSCASPGDCTAGGSFSGSYSTNDDTSDAFVMSESGGKRGTAKLLSGLGLGDNNGAQVTSVSCPAAGDCVAVGSYDPQVFVAEETNGTWGDVQEISGFDQAADSDSFDAAVGTETGGTWGTPVVVAHNLNVGETEPFVVNEVDGTWEPAEEVQQSVSNVGNMTGISCPSGGNVAAAYSGAAQFLPTGRHLGRSPSRRATSLSAR